MPWCVRHRMLVATGERRFDVLLATKRADTSEEQGVD